MAQQPSKQNHRHNRSAHFPDRKKASRCTRGATTGQKTLLCDIPDTTLTSLLRQPSTITCCDRLDINFVNVNDTEPTMPTEQSLSIMPPSMAALKSICTILASCPLSNALFTPAKVHNHRYQDLSDEQNYVIGSAPLHSTNRQIK